VFSSPNALVRSTPAGSHISLTFNFVFYHADHGNLRYLQGRDKKLFISEMEFLNGIFPREFSDSSFCLGIFPHFSFQQNAIHE
jgi:hypothetical protein